MFIARTDKDGKMISDFKQSSLQLNSIRQKFFEIVRDRKNESKTVQDEYFKRQENANLDLSITNGDKNKSFKKKGHK